MDRMVYSVVTYLS